MLTIIDDSDKAACAYTVKIKMCFFFSSKSFLKEEVVIVGHVLNLVTVIIE